MSPANKTIVRIIIGALVIGAAVTYFVFQAMQSSWAYYYSVDELSSEHSAAQSQSLRVAGRVKSGSVTRDAERLTLTFTLAGSQAELPVQYKGTVPDNFTEGREVVVEGHLGTTGVFQADMLMTKCESKYKVKVK